MAREEWEEVSFQVFTDENGVLRSGYYPTGTGAVEGNVAVDFVWGNVPMQPNDDRDGVLTSIGGGSFDYGWLPTFTLNSGTLNTGTDTVYYDNVGNSSEVGNNHTIVSTGWSNFPGYIPNYEGDGDSGPETVVPNLIGVKKSEVSGILNAANLDWSWATVTPVVSYAVASGATVTLTVDSTYNIKSGDSIWVDGLTVGATPYGLGSTTVTAVTGTTISVANAGEWTFDDDASGEVWGNDPDFVRVIDQSIEAGDIVDEGTSLDVVVLYMD